MINEIRDTQRIRLKDGRQLCYGKFGDPNGSPIFHFHGYPGSRLEGRLVSKMASRCNVRLIAVDRPGMGLSDFKQKRAFLDWPDDVIELADFLQIEKFAVEGVSGGGPYALASAYKITHRLTSAGILGGTGPKWNAGEPWRKPRSLEDTKNFLARML